MDKTIATLVVMPRSRSGKEAARAIRKKQLIPAVIYGDKHPPLHVTIDPRLIEIEISKPGFFTRLFYLSLDENILSGNSIRTICRSVQRHPVSNIIIHADFQRVSTDSLIHVAVPIHIINEFASPGVKRGGVINLVEHTITVSGQPTAIPHSIEIDITGLKIGDSIRLNQVKLSEGVHLLHSEANMTIVTIVAPSSMKADTETDITESST